MVIFCYISSWKKLLVPLRFLYTNRIQVVNCSTTSLLEMHDFLLHLMHINYNSQIYGVTITRKLLRMYYCLLRLKKQLRLCPTWRYSYNSIFQCTSGVCDELKVKLLSGHIFNLISWSFSLVLPFDAYMFHGHCINIFINPLF